MVLVLVTWIVWVVIFDALEKTEEWNDEFASFGSANNSVHHNSAAKFGLPHCRLDSRTLLQRYNPMTGSEGGTTHRTASLFSGYSAANKGNYLSVAVKYLSVSKADTTVKVIKRAALPNPNDAADP